MFYVFRLVFVFLFAFFLGPLALETLDASPILTVSNDHTDGPPAFMVLFLSVIVLSLGLIDGWMNQHQGGEREAMLRRWAGSTLALVLGIFVGMLRAAWPLDHIELLGRSGQFSAAMMMGGLYFLLAHVAVASPPPNEAKT